MNPISAKTEAILTALGLVLGVIATLAALLHDEKPSMTRRVLCVVALAGLGVGLMTTRAQYYDHKAADTDAQKADQQRDDAKAALAALQKQVGDLGRVQALTDQKTGDLTMLNRLGGGDYYVVIASFLRNSTADHNDCEKVTGRFLSLYPDAAKHGLLWTAPAPLDRSRYQLRFGRNLTPSSAGIFLSLANQGLANGRATIGRSGANPENVVVADGKQDICPP